ncbi:hypothetical protein SAMN05446934_7924 [Paraburkholderia hospita]|nr:hypothetical protein SAMN05446934_7924 [Paraburkholderia hospita]
MSLEQRRALLAELEAKDARLREFRDRAVNDKIVQCRIAYGVIAATFGIAIAFWLTMGFLNSFWSIHRHLIGTISTLDQAENIFGTVSGFMVLMLVLNAERHFHLGVLEDM